MLDPDGIHLPSGDVFHVEGHSDALAFSPDGRNIATTKWRSGSPVLILDATSGEQVKELADYTTSQSPVVFSPIGDLLAIVARRGIAIGE